MFAAHTKVAGIGLCPFCGVKLPWLFESDVNKYAVYCRQCGSIGPMGDDEDAAVRLWNARAIVAD